MDWDDYRFFAALAEQGSVRGAADLLRVNPSTVTRRLERLEASLGVVLFLRSGTGMKITPEGVDVAQWVERIARQIWQMENAVRGRDQRLAGVVRVSVPDVLAVNYLLTDVGSFYARYPDIELEILPRIRPVDLNQDPLDIIVSVTDQPPESMVGRRFAPLAVAAYGSHELVAQLNLLDGATEGDASLPDIELPWIDWVQTQGEVIERYAQLRKTYFPNVRIKLRCDHLEMQCTAMRAHQGCALLPCFVGEADPQLQRLPQMPVQAGPALWLLTHPDARSIRRVRVFAEFLREIFASNEAQLFLSAADG